MDITLLTEAAYECMSPDQMDEFEALFSDADLARRYANCVRKRLAAAQPDFVELVNRFLSWPLPERHASDRCVVDADYQFPRSGTNLLDSREAEAMLRYVLAEVCATSQGAKQ